MPGSLLTRPLPSMTKERIKMLGWVSVKDYYQVLNVHNHHWTLILSGLVHSIPTSSHPQAAPSLRQAAQGAFNPLILIAGREHKMY